MSIDFRAPRGACDCHIHVIPDSAQYPFAAGRSYTPPLATLAQLQAMHRQLGIERFVIITPSIYGVDNRVTVDTLRQLPAQARGVAVIDETVPDAELERMAQAGVRGVRFNMEVHRQADPFVFLRKLDATAERIKHLGWHIQANVRLSVIEALADRLAALPVMLVIDHFGHPRTDLGVDQPGMGALLDLLRSGRSYVKLSAVYISSAAADYADLTPFAQACIEANTERVLWASNWPHPDLRHTAERSPFDITPYRVVDNEQIFNLLPQWTTDPTVQHAMLVDNPARLYGFDQAR